MKIKQTLVTILALASLSCTDTSLVKGLEEKVNNKQEKGAQQNFQLSEDYILSKGIILKSDLWDRVKKGELSGVGRNSTEWASYLWQVERCRDNFFNRLKTPIRNELDEYLFMIKGINGGQWGIAYDPSIVIEWDDISDLHAVRFDGVPAIRFDGVQLGYTEDDLSDKIVTTIIAHEYFHAIWDIYGRFASKQTRKINKDKFEIDTGRYINDPKYKNTIEVEEIKKAWDVKEAKGKTTTVQSLTERFASLAQIYYENSNSLPDYIQRHFEPFF